MNKEQLENLAKVRKLHPEAPDSAEIQGLIRSGSTRLRDAGLESLSLESRFDLAYNAAHALSLAALRQAGYRSESRYLVFQCLQHTIDMPSAKWRVLDHAHRKRNLAEYEGVVDVDQALVQSLISVTEEIEALVKALAGNA